MEGREGPDAARNCHCYRRESHSGVWTLCGPPEEATEDGLREMGWSLWPPLRSPLLSPFLLPCPLPAWPASLNIFKRGNQGGKDINLKGLNPFRLDSKFKRETEKSSALTPEHKSRVTDGQIVSPGQGGWEGEIRGRPGCSRAGGRVLSPSVRLALALPLPSRCIPNAQRRPPGALPDDGGGEGQTMVSDYRNHPGKPGEKEQRLAAPHLP